MDKVYVGLNAMEIYKRKEKVSFKYPPPPPPAKENIANNAFIESDDGSVFFYAFAKRQPLCGYAIQGNIFELYKQDLDTLKPKDLILVDSTNIGGIMKLINAEEKPVFIVVGIQNDTTTNRVLVRIVDTLYRNSADNIWKVRKINAVEDSLLTEL